MKKSIFSNLLIFIYLIFFCLSAKANECQEIKKKFLSNTIIIESDIPLFQTRIDADDACMKNLMGLLLYEGIFFKSDPLRAERIFYDLANKNYPEAQFNFAWVLTKKIDQDPNNVLGLLIGLFARYIEDPKNSHLALKSRDLGRVYIKDLEERCNFNKCFFENVEINKERLSEISFKFEDTIRDKTFWAAANSRNEMKRIQERNDTIVMILSLGFLAYGLASSPANIHYNNPTNSGPNPWFNYGQGFGNPLNLYQMPLH